MRVLTARNVHEAFPIAVRLLRMQGTPRDSRNGPVLQLSEPVSTVYIRPYERVIFWPERDANPFLHLYEALWMLNGRNDVDALVRYAKRMQDFSDDGKTLHGAYGHRWRQHFCVGDQLSIIVESLKKDHNDRRCVLQMWDTEVDLGRGGKDHPCNLIATFQISTRQELELVVFCRSNDIVWGCYGANAVHFSLLHEYVAAAIGVSAGKYTQISVNWHGYLKTLEPMYRIEKDAFGSASEDEYGLPPMIDANPYDYKCRSLPIPTRSLQELDACVAFVVNYIDQMVGDGAPQPIPGSVKNDPFFNNCLEVLQAHFIFKAEGKAAALAYMDTVAVQEADWTVAAREWLFRRKDK